MELIHSKTGEVSYKATMRRVRVTIIFCGNVISITYSECVGVALGM